MFKTNSVHISYVLSLALALRRRRSRKRERERERENSHINEDRSSKLPMKYCRRYFLPFFLLFSDIWKGVMRCSYKISLQSLKLFFFFFFFVFVVVDDVILLQHDLIRAWRLFSSKRMIINPQLSLRSS